MQYNPQKHHRRSIRLKGYDYSQPGLYFITLCINHRICLFGEIKDGKMELNDAGRMVEKWYRELENKYNDIECGEFVVMPNHFHCIIEKMPNDDETIDPSGEQGDSVVGEQGDSVVGEQGEHTGSPLHGHPTSNNNPNHSQYGPGNKKYGVPIGVAIDWFKTMTTNEYIRGVKNNGWPRFDRKLWQRNYWEHIIRNDHSYQRISEYINNNPGNWNTDSLNDQFP